MTLDNSQLTIIGVGVTCALPAIPAVWKAATLRGATNDSLRSRVYQARAGLSEAAGRCLRQVQEEIDGTLGKPNEEFDPDTVVADPGALVGITQEFENFIRVRDKLEARFGALLFICKWAFVPALVYAVGVLLVTWAFASETEESLYRVGSLSVAGAGIVTGIVILVAYTYLHQRIATAEILGAPPAPAGDS